MRHIVSFSGGKDSTAMLLRMIELDYQIDEVIFVDTGAEFPDMYKHIEKVSNYLLEHRGLKITILKDGEKDFDYYMTKHIKTRGKYKGTVGYSWPDFQSRWCTTMLKTSIIKKYIKNKYNEDIIEYIGIAFDEPKRIKENPNIRYPLYDLKMTEKEALYYCYSKGFDFGGLYKKFDRVSCYLCPLQRIGELRIIYNDYPELWEHMQYLDKFSKRKFRPDYTFKQLDERFRKEREAEDIG